MIRPTLAFDEVKFFFEKVKGGDANDNAYPTALIDALRQQDLPVQRRRRPH